MGACLRLIQRLRGAAVSHLAFNQNFRLVDMAKRYVRKSGVCQRGLVDRRVVQVSPVPNQDMDPAVMRRISLVQTRLRNLRSMVAEAGHLRVDIAEIVACQFFAVDEGYIGTP